MFPLFQYVLSNVALVATLYQCLVVSASALSKAEWVHARSSKIEQPVNTSSWFGAEYSPSRASNSLWWWQWEEYADEVDTELGYASKQLGVSAVRMFLHTSVYEADGGKTLLSSIEKFLVVASKHSIGTGFVFFDDCWSASGANVTRKCEPVKGRHNGCWKQSPQKVDRSSVERFKPYVSDVVAKYKADQRVLWWEVYNEPNQHSNFSLALRNAAFGWIKSAQVSQPVISCWNDNNNTDVVDIHRYDANFDVWTEAATANPEKGSFFTEAGSRWYQGYPSDSGSTLMVINWLQALRFMHASGEFKAPLPGAMISWELMVGNTNTRWHWNTPDNSAEPAIPWCGHLYPDGTPASYTEAAAMRNLTTGKNEFLYFNSSLPLETNIKGDTYITVIGATQVIPWWAGIPHDRWMTDGVVEAAVWYTGSSGGTGGVILRQYWTVKSTFTGYYVGVDTTTNMLTIEKWAAEASPVFASFNLTTRENGLVLNGWNLLRAAIQGNSIQVWFNPSHADAISSDGKVRKIPPLLTAHDNVSPAEFPSGDIGMMSVGINMRVDYISLLPLSVLL